jgi:hypothetical protein
MPDHRLTRDPENHNPAGDLNPSARRVEGPIHGPHEWDARGLLTFEKFCSLVQTPPRTVRDWRRRDTGPRWTKLEGAGRLYITVAETRRFLTRCANGRDQ